MRDWAAGLQDAWNAVASAPGWIGHAIAERAAHPDAFDYILLFGMLWIAVDFVRRGFRIFWPRKKVEGTLATIALVLANGILGPSVMKVAELLEAGYERLDVPRVDPAVWSNLPGWALALLALLIYDTVNYWLHRAMHMRWLWPVHAVHHSDPAMTGLTTFRVHVFEVVIIVLPLTILLSLLGMPPDVLGGVGLLLGLFNAYVHMDLDWGHGPLRLLIASPRYHKWHHADTPKAYGKNLANIFPFLDVAFGTYYVPGICTHALGAKGVPENDVVKLLLFPFAEWGRQIRRVWRRRRKVQAGKRRDPADNAAPVAVRQVAAQA